MSDIIWGIIGACILWVLFVNHPDSNLKLIEYKLHTYLVQTTK
jgi:hypothetical protein